MHGRSMEDEARDLLRSALNREADAQGQSGRFYPRQIRAVWVAIELPVVAPRADARPAVLRRMILLGHEYPVRADASGAGKGSRTVARGPARRERIHFCHHRSKAALWHSLVARPASGDPPLRLSSRICLTKILPAAFLPSRLHGGSGVCEDRSEPAGRSGRPIAKADAQIAAIAQSRGAALATRNVPDFEGCGIDVINPWTEAGLN